MFVLHKAVFWFHVEHQTHWPVFHWAKEKRPYKLGAPDTVRLPACLAAWKSWASISRSLPEWTLVSVVRGPDVALLTNLWEALWLFVTPTCLTWLFPSFPNGELRCPQLPLVLGRVTPNLLQVVTVCLNMTHFGPLWWMIHTWMHGQLACDHGHHNQLHGVAPLKRAAPQTAFTQMRL